MLNCKFFVLFLSVQLMDNAQSAKTTVSCKDEAGEQIDWFYAYKLPKNYHNKQIVEDDKTGLHYIFVTSKNYDKWQLSSAKISDQDSITAQTLQQIFNDSTVLVLAYNDEYPNGTNIVTGGHAKGVVATDESTGIWLIHSIPKFPSVPQYEYPSSGTHYGQSLLCLTLPAAEMTNVGLQLMFNEPNIYYQRLPAMLNKKFPNLERVMQGERRTTPPFEQVLDVRTLNGQIFKIFAKSGMYGGDLYEDFVAPTLNVNLLVETWRNGAGNMPSNCTQSENVYNIAEIRGHDPELNFKTTNDHSKWAVAQSAGLKFWRWRLNDNWICVGDINRQQHQLQRGGGTVCQNSKEIAKLYRNMIAAYEPCRR